MIEKVGKIPHPWCSLFGHLDLDFFGTRSVRIPNFTMLLSFYQKYRMSTSDDDVNLRKGDEVVVIDGSLHGIEGHVMGITP